MAEDPREHDAGPAGWYPDAADPDGTMRWWDGNAWTISRPRLAADGPAPGTQDVAAAPSRPGPGTVGATAGLPAAPANRDTAVRKPFWRSPRVWAAVVVIAVAVLGGLGSIARHFSNLDDTRSGTQQQWIDYFDRARPAVSTFNDSSPAAKDIGSALDTLATSPDDSLNEEARAARRTCVPKPKDTCRAAMRKLVDDYNDAIREASDKGLVKIEE